jgi:hypothetical protein
MTLYQLVTDNEHAVAQVRRMYDKEQKISWKIGG